jgi:hypothetical protein
MRKIGQWSLVQVVWMRLCAPAVIAAGLLLSGAAAVTAPAAAQPTNAEQLCTPDVMRLCGEFIPDRRRILACLKRKRFALSPGCKQVFSPPKSSARRRTAYR